MSFSDTNPQPRVGDFVVLIATPPGLLNGLPLEDQKAITEIVGTPILLSNYDDDGRAELVFNDRRGHVHYIYVDPSLLRSAG